MKSSVRFVTGFLSLITAFFAVSVSASCVTQDASQPEYRAVLFRGRTAKTGGTADDKGEKLQDGSPLIALTFDDGPSTRYTNRILDMLEIDGGRATFFVIGASIEKHAEAMVRAYSMGCEIGNHTFTHANLTRLSSCSINNEISKADDAIFNYLLEEPRYVRPPEGGCNHAVIAAVNKPIILWSIDTGDWRFGVTKYGNTKQNRRKVIENVMREVQDGDIILMHDLYEFTADLCEELIPELRRAGYQLVTLSELFDAFGIKPENGTVYHKANRAAPED